MSRSTNQIRINIRKGDVAFNHATPETYNSALDAYLEAALHVVEKKWSIPVHQKICSIISADINNDDKDEVLFGTEEHMLFAYESYSAEKHKTPRHLWKNPFHTNDWINEIAVADINGDGCNEIIVASDNIYILNMHGHQIGEHHLNCTATSLSIYEDKDGKKMIAIGDNQGSIKCYDYDFNELWLFPFKKSNCAVNDLAIGDFDSDGQIEVAAASEDKYVYIIDDKGDEKDRIDTEHWIINIAECRMKNSKLRLFIGKFTGDTLVYKHKQTSQAASLKQSGILDLKVEYIFDSEKYPQFIVGSSDRCLSIFDYYGEPIWIFESGLGQRVLSVKKIDNEQLDLLVGTESGEVFYYSINLVKDLVSKIKSAYSNISILDLLDLKLAQKKLNILRNYIEYNPIKPDASLEKAQMFSCNDFNKAVVSGMEVWFNNCNFLWSFSTQGRVYDLAPYHSEKGHGLLAGSDDGTLYCLNKDGSQEWTFNSRKDLRGISQGIRSVYYDIDSGNIFVASTDKSLYKLNHSGDPQWNFHHEDWMFFTCSGYLTDNQSRNIFAGTEDGYVLAFDEGGLLLWKTHLGKRVRALTFCDNYKGHSYIIAGCDDNKVYIIDSNGNIYNSFSTPHYVLIVRVFDIYGDKNTEILIGNEDGHLYVCDFKGNLLWRFETGSWVAALDILKKENGEIEIIIGSQDNSLYVLNQYGALLWQYDSNARVRTILVDSKTNRISFGSYDKNIYMLEEISRDKSVEFLRQLYIDNIKISADKENERIQKLLSSSTPNRHKRAFVYLFTKSEDLLKKGISDQSDIVAAAIGYNIAENFLADNKLKNELINLIVNSNRKVKALILCRLIDLMNAKKLKKHIVANVLRKVIKSTPKTSSKIDVFRYWLMNTNKYDEILRMVKHLIPKHDDKVDEFLIDELNRTGIILLKINTNESDDDSIIDTIEKISNLIKRKYPETADRLKDEFL